MHIACNRIVNFILKRKLYLFFPWSGYLLLDVFNPFSLVGIFLAEVCSFSVVRNNIFLIRESFGIPNVYTHFSLRYTIELIVFIVILEKSIVHH